MTSPWYNPKALTPFTTATAEAVNSEFAKIAAAFDQLPAPGSVGSGAAPVYTHFAYADSADGTANFTTGTPGTRSYIGVQANVTSPTPSPFPENYNWSRITGTDGTEGRYREFRFIRSDAQPPQPVGDIPAGTSLSIPSGTERLWVTSATRNGAGILISAWEPFVLFGTPPTPGVYSDLVTYYFGMQALYNGGTYVLKVDSSIGNPPSGTDQANTWWDVIAAPGLVGPPAVPPSAFTATIGLTSSSGTVNLRTLANAAGYTGLSNATITFEVPAGVTISGLNGGGVAIDSGSWPSSSYTIALALLVKTGALVDGGGGNGGNGGSGGPGTAGSAGGDAIYLREDFSGGITIQSGATVRGGGGGGGGGKGQFQFGNAPGTELNVEDVFGSAGGGGGGGAPNGLGGTGGTTLYNGITAASGGNGTTLGAGTGGAGENDGSAAGDVGAPGGAFGAAGGSRTGAPGGAPGFAVRKNGKTATVTNSGTMIGSAS